MYKLKSVKNLKRWIFKGAYMRVLPIKSTIPIIWLDTFFLIEYNKVNLNLSADDRYIELYNLIKDKVKKKKLLCVRAAQEEEIYDDVENTLKHFFELSRENQFKSSYEVRKIQNKRMMDVYFNKRVIFNTKIDDILIEQSDETNSSFIVQVYSVPTTSYIEKIETEKTKNMNELQELKSKIIEVQEYEERLNIEFKGIYQATTDVLDRYIHKAGEFKKFDNKFHNQFQYLIEEPLEDWYNITSNKNDVSGYIEFLLSDEYKCIPQNNISSRMLADIMISAKRFKSGDKKDVNNISTFLPYYNYILTDKEQKNRVKRLGIDKEYNTSIYCMNNIDQLIEDLKVL